MTISTETFLTVGVGSVTNDGTGDTLRTAFIKVNDNFQAITDIGFDAGNINVAGSIEVVGNVVADYLIGNGSQLTGLEIAVSTAFAALEANAAAQAGELAELTTNAAVQAGELSTLLSNAAIQAGELSSLVSNAAAQAGAITDLQSNAAAQAGLISAIESNLSVQIGLISSAEGNITAANIAMKGYVDGEISTLTSNAGAQAGALSSLESNAAVQAGLITGLDSNIVIQAGEIANLWANAGAQAGAISNLEISKANLSGAVFTGTVTGNVFQSNVLGLGISPRTTLDIFSDSNSSVYISDDNSNNTLSYDTATGFLWLDGDAAEMRVTTYFQQSSLTLEGPGSPTLYLYTTDNIDGSYGRVFSACVGSQGSEIRFITANVANDHTDIAFLTTRGGQGLTEKVRITNRGNVGIGTDSPQNKLDVNGAATISGNITASNFLGNIPFTMSNVTHWTSNVSTLADAINQLAERIYNIENP